MKHLSMITATAAAAVLITVGASYAGCGACGSHEDKAQQASGAKTELKAQTTCPVMGGKIDRKQYADVKGKRIYVCCAGCIDKIKAAPDHYIEKLEKAGVKLESVPEGE